ncbi:MAG: helix-turn-helix transcriptional regulator [Polyangiaceae bacterium]
MEVSDSKKGIGGAESGATSLSSIGSTILELVQTGTRLGFRRRVLDTLSSQVRADGSFFCLGRDDARAYAESVRVVSGTTRDIALTDRSLSIAFGFDPKSVIQSPRRVYLASELYPRAVRDALPYFANNSVPDGLTDAILIFLHEGGVLFGVAGLERKSGGATFDAFDVERLEELTPYVMAGLRMQISYEELSREAAALRTLAKVTGTVYVVDRDKKRVVWAANRTEGIDWNRDVLAAEDQIILAAEELLAASARGEALPTPPQLPTGIVHAVTKLDADPVFGASRYAVLRVEAPKERAEPAKMEGLSKREREIARLLVAGYSGVNVAAIAGLSENTVRTYVRRLYAKLAVSNRADLVRKLVAPEPQARQSSAPSALPPTPDSSLAYGDDTLD